MLVAKLCMECMISTTMESLFGLRHLMLLKLKISYIYLKEIHWLSMHEYRLAITISKIEFLHNLKLFAVNIIPLLTLILRYRGWRLWVAEEIGDIFHPFEFLQLLRFHVDLLDFDIFRALYSTFIEHDTRWTASILVGGVLRWSTLRYYLIVYWLMMILLIIWLLILLRLLLLLPHLQDTLVFERQFIACLEVFQGVCCLVGVWTGHQSLTNIWLLLLLSSHVFWNWTLKVLLLRDLVLIILNVPRLILYGIFGK